MLDAKLGDYVVIARRHNQEWYVGAMTDWTARELEIDFSFLPSGNYRMEAYQDGMNADRVGSDYLKSSVAMTNTTRTKVRLAGGGGWAARIVRAKQ